MPYVYLIAEQPHDGDASGPWTKIGYTRNPPEWRLDANLKRGNSRALVVAAAFEYDTEQQARRAEREAHQKFQEMAVGKEWFRIAWQDVALWLDSIGASRRTTQDFLSTQAEEQRHAGQD
ncbi:MAG: GIY-YIG nuclease family protein [Dokdonella sp.]|uniref:GIY-YIG nuclease family protein n=1 Tax=Dokdonella sp. TaxID=2291710 RepID=UPI0025BA3A25|nr:GIY-YIG nuclease family protein [Dokdonella sp.]MBZ0223286.1 GIY-YIG nuclease family protein [Dokdonella sp.]